MCLDAGFADNDFVNATKKILRTRQGHNQGLFLKDQDQDLSVKDQDKDKNLSSKDQDQDFKFVLKDSLRTRTRTRTTTLALGGPFLASGLWNTDFSHLTESISKTVSRSVTYLDGSLLKMTRDGSSLGAPPWSQICCIFEYFWISSTRPQAAANSWIRRLTFFEVNHSRDFETSCDYRWTQVL